MSFQPIKSIQPNIFSGDIKKIENEVNQIISYCKMLRKEIKSSNSIKYTKHMIIEHMYIIYYCFKCIGIVKLTSKLNIEKYDREVESYLENFFSESETHALFNQLLKNAKDEKNKDEIYFYENMIDKCSKSKNGSEIEKKIKIIQENIHKELNSGEIIKIPENLKHIFKNKNSILLNRKLFYSLLKKIENPFLRKKIEELYFSKSEKCLEMLEELVLLRSEYANVNDKKTYFEFVKRRDKSISGEIVMNLMKDLIKKVISRSNKETLRIWRKLKNDGHEKKVEYHDFIFYYEEMCSKCNFSLEESFKILLDMVNKYFNIEFKEYKCEEILWNNDIKSYKAYSSHNEFLGNIHFDLNHNSNKKISSPICVHMSHNYNDTNNNHDYSTNIAIIGNFANNEIKHSDFISLSKEMGNAIQFLSYKTTTGNMFYRDNFYLLTSKIMEHLSWEKSVLSKLCKKDKQLVEHLLFTRFIDLGNSINLRCINAYFDYILHNNKELVDDLKNYKKKHGKFNGEIFKNLYQGIYRNTFASQKDIFETDINLMHPIVIFNEINGLESSVYENIIVEILSFSVFYLIKENEGKKYIKILSKAGSSDFKESLNKFINKLGDNYILYLQELIGYNEIDTELNMKIKNDNSAHSSTNDTANYFTDEKSEDKEEVFIVDRKLEI
jgi:Zn-dependent oligopeptidase